MTLLKIPLKKGACSILLCFLLLSAFQIFQPGAYAELRQLENRELEEITGQAGVSIAIKNVEIYHFIDSFTYTCPEDGAGTCEGYLMLENIEFHSRTTDTMLFNFDPVAGNRLIDPVR